MWSYYDLAAAQDQANRIQLAEYRVSPGAWREVTQEAIARHLNQKHQSEREEKEAARRMALATFANTVKAIFRNRAALAR
ncbi:MAG: hypothetical protein OEU46_09085 [Alphaproteobacteria bacterium]|nr:hypothetical protein [Alphaproteobacteria bacterium]